MITTIKSGCNCAASILKLTSALKTRIKYELKFSPKLPHLKYSEICGPAIDSISITSFATVIGALVGMANASLSLVFSMSNNIV